MIRIRDVVALAIAVAALFPGSAPGRPRSLVVAQASAETTQGDLERRIRQAREQGFWVVEEGDHLYRIARLFHPENRQRMEALRRELFERNPDAFLNGKPALLVVGARLRLPPDFRIDRISPAPSPPVAGAPRTVPREAPGAPPPPPPAATAADAPSASPERRTGEPTRPRAAAQAEPYVDLLIEGAAAAIDREERLAADQPSGLRSVSLESRSEYRAPVDGGRGFETGIELRVRPETLDYGEFVLDAGARHAKPAPDEFSAGSSGNHGRATLYQNRFPLAEGWIANSSAGVTRTPFNPLLASGYRVNLPGSIFSGFATQVASPSRELQLFGGRIGRLEGTTTQSFTETTGSLFGAGYTRRLGGPWSARGALAIATRGSRDVRDHETLALAAEYRVPLPRTRVKAEVLADGDGNLGGILDADFLVGSARHRTGIFRLDPGLHWNESALANDQQGAYWRMDLATHGQSSAPNLTAPCRGCQSCRSA